jgi:hypothetical protein
MTNCRNSKIIVKSSEDVSASDDKGGWGKERRYRLNQTYAADLILRVELETIEKEKRIRVEFTS